MYNKVFARWTTHQPMGLSEKDLVMANICEKLADEWGDKADAGEGIDFQPPKGTAIVITGNVKDLGK